MIFWLIQACTDSYFEKLPPGTVSEEHLANTEGINTLLIGAYSVLDGVNGITTWEAAGSNWIYGSVASDDAHVGSDEGDATEAHLFERYDFQPLSGYLHNKWRVIYDGISRCNDVIRITNMAHAKGTITSSHYDQYIAEARALRAHFHFEGKIIFGNIMYIDEKVGTSEGPSFYETGNVDESGNYIDIWPYIERDLIQAIDGLPSERSEKGRIDQWAAKGILARVYMHWQGRVQNGIDPSEPPGLGSAEAILDDIIENGPFELVESYHDNYRIASNNNVESIFEIQASVNDGSLGENGNYGDVLNFPYGSTGPGTCCGFHQPSQNLVNAFLTDPVTGLPYLYDFNTRDFRWDMGIPSHENWDRESGYWIDPDFVPYGRDDSAESIDPRLDWVVGRRGIPYLDWALHPGDAWIRKQWYGGPYSPKKQVYYKEEEGIMSTASGWAKGATANNIRLIRLAHILLWRAEIAVDENDLDLAMYLVNQIRGRAANQVVMARDTAGNELNTPACTGYNIMPYLNFPDKDYARIAVRHEIRLEFGMDGNRFFDLVRWGIAAEVLNDYVQIELTRPIGNNSFENRRYFLHNVNFEKDKNERYPIPQDEIDLMGKDILKQNPGY